MIAEKEAVHQLKGHIDEGYVVRLMNNSSKKNQKQQTSRFNSFRKRLPATMGDSFQVNSQGRPFKVHQFRGITGMHETGAGPRLDP